MSDDLITSNEPEPDCTGGWAIDVSSDVVAELGEGVYAYVPLEIRNDGQVNIMFGMTMVTDLPPGPVIAVVHPDGQEPVERWMEDPDHRAEVERIVNLTQGLGDA